MAKTILICGYGPGISASVAQKFGKAGFSVALVARNADRLESAVQSLAATGVQAAAFPADLSDPAILPALIESVRAKLGPISVLQWNAYAGGAGDLLTADVKALRGIFDVPVTSFLSAVQAVLPDLRASKDGAVLVTNGGLGLFDPEIDALAVQWGAMGLAVANAAKHKAVSLLAEKLKPEGIYVGEVIVLGTVKGTAWDDGTAKLEADTIAAKFWEIYSARRPTSAQVG